MKVSVNMTNCDDDMQRFANRDDFLDFISRFDGVELSCYGEFDKTGIIPAERVVGLHLNCPPLWIDMWNEDEEALVKNFGSVDEAIGYYGGWGKEPILASFCQGMSVAHQASAEYVVYHVSDTDFESAFTFSYSKSSEQVIKASLELINALLAEEDGSIAFLMENQWEPGLNWLNMDVAQQLLDGVAYSNKGFMLDTGHLMHTCFDLETSEQAREYILGVIDRMGDLSQSVRGMHLQQGLSGAYCKQMKQNPPLPLPKEVQEIFNVVFPHIFKLDPHEPFTAAGVERIIERLPLEFLTFEYITSSRKQLQDYIDRQWQALSCLAQSRTMKS